MSDFLFVHFSYILRILIAGICGIFIGYERNNRAKEAGVRTHGMVACGAALVMVVSKYAFADISALPNIASVDVSRIASSVVSGIGFLGAGMIFVRRNMVSGLTTAAGIWVTAGIGLAIGAGLYIEGIATTLIVLMIQILLHNHCGADKSYRTKKLTLYGITDISYSDAIVQKLKKHSVNIIDTNINKIAEDNTEFRLIIEIPSYISDKLIIGEFDCSCEITSNY